VAQVSIRYLLQKDILPLPKSTTPSRIAENADVDFELSAEDVAALDALDAKGM
jgi:diketogulonate reductase-like aldo/keto reductase